MVAGFFCKTGHVATVPLEHRRTVNSEWYATICLPEVFGEIRKRTKEDESLFTMIMQALRHRLKHRLFDRPNSPNLAPKDFFNFFITTK